MKRFSKIMLLALVIGLLPVAWLSNPRRTVKAEEHKVIHIQEHVIAANGTYVPVCTLVPETCAAVGTQGDTITWYNNPDVDPTTGKTVGYDLGECTLANPSTQLYTCANVQFVLTDRGQIAAGGMYYGSGEPASGPILGGTGEFTGARGTYRVQAFDGGTINDFIFTLCN
jgi:hypothetical protein